MVDPPDRDPTALFSVVGIPYVREQSSGDFQPRDAGGSRRPRRFAFGLAVIGAALLAVVLGGSLAVNHGPAKLIELAYRAVK